MTLEQTPRIGLLLPSRETVLWLDGDLTFLIGAAQLAEQAGYDSLWVGDSLLARPRGEPLALLAAIAAVTTRVRLGTAVLLPLLRHPLNLAHTVASVDRIADGWLPFSRTAGDYAAGLRAVRQAAEGAGRDPDTLGTGVYLTVAVADDARRAAQELDAYMRAYYGVPAEVMAQSQACHAGTLESASEWVAGYAAAGARELVLRLARPTLDDYHVAVRELLGAVRPRMR